VWHLHDERQRDEFLARACPFVIDEAVAAYRSVLARYDWRAFASRVPHHHVEYRDLLDRPAVVLAGVLEYLGVPTDTVERAVEGSLGDRRRYHRMTRPESAKYARLLGGFARGKMWL
jgi:hypothetical protein